MVQAEDNYILLQREKGSHPLRQSISTVGEKLRPCGFIRIHRSVLVNSSFVQEIRPGATGEYLLRARWTRIRRYAHLQKESQVPDSFLDQNRDISCRLTGPALSQCLSVCQYFSLSVLPAPTD